MTEDERIEAGQDSEDAPAVRAEAAEDPEAAEDLEVDKDDASEVRGGGRPQGNLVGTD